MAQQIYEQVLVAGVGVHEIHVGKQLMAQLQQGNGEAAMRNFFTGLMAVPPDAQAANAATIGRNNGDLTIDGATFDIWFPNLLVEMKHPGWVNTAAANDLARAIVQMPAKRAAAERYKCQFQLWTFHAPSAPNGDLTSPPAPLNLQNIAVHPSFEMSGRKDGAAIAIIVFVE